MRATTATVAVLSMASLGILCVDCLATATVVWRSQGTLSGQGSVVLVNNTTPTADTYALADRLVFLYWSPDPSTSGFDISNLYTPSGGDRRLGYLSSGTAGRLFGPSTASTYTDITGGYAYFAFFNAPYSGFTEGDSPAAGTLYGVSVLSPQLNAGAPDTPVDFTTTVTRASPLVVDQVVPVPEPASILLVVSGIGLVMWRRRPSSQQ
jgi:hypothetical protein